MALGILEMKLFLSNLYDVMGCCPSIDIVAYLVAHKEFKRFKTEAIELDFCGVKK